MAQATCDKLVLHTCMKLVSNSNNVAVSQWNDIVCLTDRVWIYHCHELRQIWFEFTTVMSLDRNSFSLQFGNFNCCVWGTKRMPQNLEMSLIRFTWNSVLDGKLFPLVISWSSIENKWEVASSPFSAIKNSNMIFLTNFHICHNYETKVRIY